MGCMRERAQTDFRRGKKKLFFFSIRSHSADRNRIKNVSRTRRIVLSVYGHYETVLSAYVRVCVRVIIYIYIYV